jgi:Large polyvalent protein associated domain 39
MSTAIDVGDALPSLEQSRQEAQASLAAAGGSVGNTDPVPVKIPAASKGVQRSPVHTASLSLNPSDIPVVTGKPDDMSVHPDFNAPPPTPAPPVVREDNTDPWDPKTLLHFVRDEMKGTGTELANTLPRVGAQFGVLLGRGAAGIATIADHEINALNDAWDAVSGGPGHHQRDQDSRLADSAFKLVDDWLKPAVDSWTPDRAVNTGQGTGSGGVAQAIGTGAEAAPYMALGHAGIVPMLAQASTQSMYDQIDQGHDIKTAFAAGTIDGLTNYLQMKFGVIASQPLLRRVITAIPLGDLMKITGDYAKKIVLAANGYADAAAKINPFADLGEATVQNAIFGAMGGKPKEAKGESNGKPVPPAAGSPQAAPVPSGAGAAGSAPPAADSQAPIGADNGAPSPPASAVPPPAAPVETQLQGHAAPSAPSPVPDLPTPESAKGLRSQFNDMRDPATPRTGVFVPKDNKATLTGSPDANAVAVNNQIGQAEKQGRTIELPQGTLILKTTALKTKAEADIKAGTDPQDVIGLHTGAGDGKSPDATHVVQGKDAAGNTVLETAVKAEDVPAAVTKVEDQGKTPVVTTPDAAVQERVDQISTERNTPTKMGIMTTPSGHEVAVHVEPGAPDGQMRVRALDAEGEPSMHTVDVPAERVKVGTASDTKAPASEAETARADVREAPAPKAADVPVVKADEAPPAVTPEGGVKAAEAKPEKVSPPAATEDTSQPKPLESETPPKPPEAAVSEPKVKAKKPITALAALPEALEAHEQQEQVPEDKKFPASLAERQDNASAFASVLKAAAESAAGKTEPANIERALKAAKAAERLTEKGKAATDKGQGTGHVKVTALVNEMHKAARGLLGKSVEGDDVTVAPKAAEMKAKADRAKGKLSLAKKPVEAEAAEPKVEVPVNPKYADQIKKPKAAEPAPKKNAPDIERTARRLQDRFIWADGDDEVKSARADVEQFLHEHFSDQHSPAEIKNILHLLEARRIDENPDSVRERKMSETLDDDDVTLDPTDKYEGMQRGGREVLSQKEEAVQKITERSRMDKELDALTKKASDNGILQGLSNRVDTGEHVSSHDLLNRLIGSTETPLLRDMLVHLRERMPDVPIYMVKDVKNLKTGDVRKSAAGLFSGREEAIQGTFRGGPRQAIATLIHEMRHAATAIELQNNPKGELAAASNSAWRILVNRMIAKYGAEDVGAHMAFWDGQGPKPDNYKQHLYGTHNPLEMHAELDNPAFQREVAESENFAQPGENIPKGTGGLLGRLFHMVGKFFHADPKLLRHLGDLSEQVMDTQKTERRALSLRDANDRAKELAANLQERLGSNPLEAAKSTDAFMKLEDEEPKPLRGVDKDVSEIAGPQQTLVARAFKHAVGSKALDAVRTVVTKLKSVDQIFRDHRGDFGHPDDPKNALSRLENVDTAKNVLIHKMSEITRPVAEKWLKLSESENKTLGQLMIDSTSYKLDARKELGEQVAETQDDKKAGARLTEFQQRLKALSPTAQEVYGEAIDANRRIAREVRKAGVDAALHTFSDTDITPAQRSLLYGAKTHEVYDSLIGEGKLIDVGGRNGSLRDALASFASLNETAQPYLHLGRTGDYVVHAAPEGTKEFATKGEAQAFADRVTNLSPNSKGTYSERGGKHVVDYKADYTSFHNSRAEAEEARDAMTKFGLDVGNVTQKTLGKGNTPLAAGARDIVAEAERKINAMGDGKPDEGSQALVDSLRSAFLQIAASRSAYAGSKLARKASAGVKPEEMRKNFADYAQSTIWHAAQMRTVFDQASALAEVRGMARDSDPSIPQKTTYRRGQVVAALNEHMQDEVQNFGHKSPFNSMVAKLGFMSYLASPSHAFIWSTQNFTTGIPVAGARWGYGKATSSFTAAMKMVAGPAFRSTIHNVMARGGNASAVHDAIIAAVKADPRFGKWAKGENSPLQQLIDRGVISHAYSNELGALARGDSATVARVFEFARLLPNMADAFNRVSTALAGLEMTGGDLRKTADFTREIHADYSSANKPLYFKKLGRVPGGNSLTMFKTYTQAMAHLLYGNVKASFSGDRKMEAAKTVAGMMVGTSLFAGVFAGAALEPLRLASYAYHKLFDDEGEAYDLKNQVAQWLHSALGDKAGTLAQYGLPHALGFDLSSRMGLSDLFFHDMPDLLSSSKDNWKNFIYNESGTMTSMLAGNVTNFMGHMQKGEPFQALSSIIPIKQWQDATKAYQLATTGKVNSLGGQMTEPSLGDAAYQLLGLKPASVAEAQDRSSTAMNYKGDVKDTRDAVMKDFVSSTDKARALVRLNRFNTNHPAEAIKGNDLVGLMRAREMERQNLTRDPELQKRLSVNK